MKRRTFLGVSLGAAALLAGAGLGGIQPRRRTVRDTRARPLLASQSRRVVVVGGGLAGLSAASDLVERGFEVTLIEQAAQLGGKVSAWNTRVLDEDWPIEHGFHGFFAQYYTLNELLERSGADRSFVDSPGYPVRFNGRPDERFGTTTSLFPANLLSVIARSPNIALADFRGANEGLLELMRYRGEATYAALDDIDFATFCKERGVPPSIRDTVFLPFAATTLNRPERLSAAEAIRFFHFYFLGNPEGLRFRCLTRDAGSAVIEPIVRRLRDKGARVLTSTRVARLLWGQGRITGVALGAHSTTTSEVLTLGGVARDRWVPLTLASGHPVLVRRPSSGPVVVLDGRCTHMGCPVGVGEEGGLVCPCHGGRFDDEGRPTAGPPQRPLRRLPVVRDDDDVRVILEGASTSETVPCDHCVIACEVRGLKALVEQSSLYALESVARTVGNLGESEPYVVMRVWLDGPTDPRRPPFASTHGYRFTDSLAIYSAFQEPCVSWARATRGSVVETHAYALRAEDDLPLAAIEEAMLTELRRLLPELAHARVLHVETRRQDDFSRFAPGDARARPGTHTAFPNLFLAGDHISLPVPAALMEAAVLSGRFAANAILDAEGLKESDYTTVPLEGPLA